MSDALYVEVNGSGGDIILLHGWGMHGGVWGEFQQLLSPCHKVHTIDLPGYGFSRGVKSDYKLSSFTNVIEDYIDKNIKSEVTLVAWSLSGLIALDLVARKITKIKNIVFIASTPCFTQKESWQHGIEKTIFHNFAYDLEQNYKKTLQRFLSLQTRGSDIANQDLRKLKNKLNERSEPHIDALKQGLKILSEQDLRTGNKYTTPALVLLGEKDTLVPVGVKSEFEKMFSNIEVEVLENVGHAPFITRAVHCSERIKKFINE